MDAEWRESKTAKGKTDLKGGNATAPSSPHSRSQSLPSSSSLPSSTSPSSSSILSRAYYAPHGSSLVVDTRQSSSEYELERTERFMQQDGQRMIVEIRILSAAPAPVAVEAKPSHSRHRSMKGKAAADTKPKVEVREILCLRRVYKRIQDANPAVKAMANTAATNAPADTPFTSSRATSDASIPASSSSSMYSRPALPAFASSSSSSSYMAGSTSSSSSSSTNVGAHARDNSQTVSAGVGLAHPAPLRPRPSYAPKPLQITQAAAAILPDEMQKELNEIAPNIIQPSNDSNAPSSASSSSAISHAASTWSAFCDRVLYPRPSLMRQYGLEPLCADSSPPTPQLSSSSATIAAEEQRIYDSVRRSMRLIDVLLLVFTLLFFIHRFGILDLLSSSSSSSTESSTLRAHDPSTTLHQTATVSSGLHVHGKTDL